VQFKPISITPYHCHVAYTNSGEKKKRNNGHGYDLIPPVISAHYVLWYRCSCSRTRT